MKKLLVKIVMVVWLLWMNIANIFAFRMDVPTPSWQDDIIVNWSTKVETTETELIDLINIINEYLRFIIAGLAFVIFVYAGITLITWWSKDKMWKANKMLISSVIAIIVSMLSYTIVKILINLF